MSTAIPIKVESNRDYPTADGRPMAETDLHRELMFDLIKTLQARYADHPMVYVSGNLLLFYEPGNKRRHISPDVFVVRGVPRKERLNYLVWEEGKGPDVVIELTSSSTRMEDVKKKYSLYQDRLGVQEYFLFDPYGDYLKPPLQGHRRQKAAFVPIKAAHDRLPSKVLDLHLERDGKSLRLFDPRTGQRLPTPSEAIAQAEAARRQAEVENERLRREVEALRRQLPRE